MPPVNVPRARALEAIRPKPARAPGIVTIQYARRKAFVPRAPPAGWRPAPGVTRTALSTRTLDGTALRHLRVLFQRAWPAALSAQYHCSVHGYCWYYSLYILRWTYVYCAGRAIVREAECRGRLQRAGLYPPLQRPTTVRCTRECDWLCVTAAHTRLGDDYIRRPRQSGPSPHPYST